MSTTLDATTGRSVVRARARRMHERLAARAGLALLAWSRPKAALSHEEVAHRRHLEQQAVLLHAITYAGTAVHRHVA
ncbi:hypothetical protein ACGGZK_03720 [Agromyces sp. MMS24-K17]|uniref:hypothetical protein n=1 Tax=Agromyces sp. MMS24-K17 TaxID=3372850 RepID=UPI003754A052